MELKSTFLSKINWAQLLAVVAMLLTTFGIDLPADVQSSIVAAIVAIQAVVTWILRTFYTTTMTPAAASKAGLI